MQTTTDSVIDQLRQLEANLDDINLTGPIKAFCSRANIPLCEVVVNLDDSTIHLPLDSWGVSYIKILLTGTIVLAAIVTACIGKEVVYEKVHSVPLLNAALNDAHNIVFPEENIDADCRLRE